MDFAVRFFWRGAKKLNEWIERRITGDFEILAKSSEMESWMEPSSSSSAIDTLGGLWFRRKRSLLTVRFRKNTSGGN